MKTNTLTVPLDAHAVRAEVRKAYAAVAQRAACCEPGTTSACCGGGGPPAVGAEKLGYRPEEIAVAPEGADLGLGCGNPHALASLRPGETVLDLGSGAGFDCFLAARAVGPPGRSTRKASRKTRGLSGERLMTQLERMTSTEFVSTGSDSISPSRNSIWRTPAFAAFARAC